MPFELDTAQYKPPPKPKSKAKKSKTKANGRGPSFDNCLAKVSSYMIQHPAFRALNASSVRVLLMCLVKHDNAKWHMRQDEKGRYVWTFTYADGKQYCGLSNGAFSEAIQRLEKVGFLIRTMPGGLKGANGIASHYSISEGWKSWKPEQENKPSENIKKARAALLEKSEANS